MYEQPRVFVKLNSVNDALLNGKGSCSMGNENPDSSQPSTQGGKAKKFKKARQKQLKKITETENVKNKKAKDWAAFTEGLREFADMEGARFQESRKVSRQRCEKDGEAEERPIVTKMQSEEICMLGKKLCVINTENEAMVLRRIREIESLMDEGKRYNAKNGS